MKNIMRTSYISGVRKTPGTGGDCATRTIAFDWKREALLPEPSPPKLPVATPPPPPPALPPSATPMRGTFIEPVGPLPPPLKIDALYSGRLTGTVPPGWSRDGWVVAMRDNIRRTDDGWQRDRFIAEINAVDSSNGRVGDRGC